MLKAYQQLNGGLKGTIVADDRTTCRCAGARAT